MEIQSLESENASKLFNRVRPTMPDKMVTKIVQYAIKEKAKESTSKVCIDVGCGTGLSTVKISKELSDDWKIIGIDISKFQIEEANRQLKPEHAENHRISYSVIDANKALPYEDGTVDLITCVQAAHWLQTGRFFKECERVLRPSGVLAIASYKLCRPDLPGASIDLNKRMDGLLDELQTQLECSGLWPGRKELLHQYKDIQLPFDEQIIVRDDKSYRTYRQTTLSEFFGYVETWSALRSFQTQNPHSQLFDDFKQKFLNVLPSTYQSELASINVIYPWFLLMCRKPE